MSNTNPIHISFFLEYLKSPKRILSKYVKFCKYLVVFIFADMSSSNSAFMASESSYLKFRSYKNVLLASGVVLGATPQKRLNHSFGWKGIWLEKEMIPWPQNLNCRDTDHLLIPSVFTNREKMYFVYFQKLFPMATAIRK